MKQNPFYKFLTAEQRYHLACVRWLKIQYPKLLFTHPDNESKKTPFERYLYAVMGVRTGLCDLLIFQRCKGYAGLAIELKCGKNKSSPAQKETQIALAANGWLVVEVWDEIDDFIKIVNDYLRV